MVLLFFTIYGVFRFDPELLQVLLVQLHPLYPPSVV